MRIRWTEEAGRNVEGIGERIRSENPTAADRIVASIERSVKHLSAHPLIGRPGRVAGTRELIVTGGPYIVAYHVTDSEAWILRVVHDSQDWPDNIPLAASGAGE